MSKKTFAAAPKPKQLTDDQIAAFERGGPGHDTKAAAAAPVVQPAADAPNSEGLKRLSVNMPDSLHLRFKTACSATGRKMLGEVLLLIEARTAELEREAGITRK